MPGNILMKRLVAFVGAVALATALAFPGVVSAAPGCTNCAPTIAVVNGDGTVTVSTTAVPNGGCLGNVSPTKYACNIHVTNATGGLGSYYTDGNPTTLAGLIDCPCTAQFWVHAGQWHAYSAVSASFSSATIVDYGE